MKTELTFTNDIRFNEALQALRAEDISISDIVDKRNSIIVEWVNFEELKKIQAIITK